MFIPDPDFYRTPDPGVKKVRYRVPDPDLQRCLYRRAYSLMICNQNHHIAYLINFLSAGNGRLTYLVPKPKAEKVKAETEEETETKKEEEEKEKSNEEGEESLYDRFGRMLKRS